MKTVGIFAGCRARDGGTLLHAADRWCGVQGAWADLFCAPAAGRSDRSMQHGQPVKNPGRL